MKELCGHKIFSMHHITKTVISVAALFYCSSSFGQQDSAKMRSLDEVIITGQYKPQSVKNSVYQVRVINSERIRFSGATSVQQVLNNQLGFRFSNDNTLGTSDVQLMGMSGRNVKILLDGVPMVDRGDTRESLNQVDINTIERIEIVEGPMSVSYGSDALAGVVNIVTKKKQTNGLSLTAKVQEETAGSEYHPFNYKGAHTQNIGLGLKKNNWNLFLGGTHNEADGFGGDAYGRSKDWKPKEQWMGNIKLGYSNAKFNIYYRFDGLNEKITARNAINYNNYKAIDQRYITDRFTHQLQGELRFNNKMQLSSVIAYSIYQRHTKTTRHDFEKDTDELTTGAGEQDISKFNSFVFQSTLNYQLSSAISLQPGVDINRDEAAGDRIAGNPVITNYAFFVSSEIKPTHKINIRPGLRFIKNSVYNAPPIIPAINTKFVLTKNLDLRMSYAYGFRSPALRELYFYFVDANHNITGNPNLKAEYSNSFTGSLNWAGSLSKDVQVSAALGAFYNVFNNQIDFALASASSNQYTYFNINKAKTLGGTLEKKISWKKINAAIGFSYIGYYRELYDDKNYVREDDRNFLWSPEISSSIGYNIDKLKTRLSLFYKYTGKKPQFVTGTNASNQPVLYVAETAGYHLADLTAFTTLNKYVSVSAGVKNIFDVTNVSSTAGGTGSIHSSGGPTPISYGRSYFLGLNYQWNKK